MKAFAARPRDTEDIRELARMLDLHTVNDVLTSVRAIFPEEEPPERLRLLLEDIFPEEDDQSPGPVSFGKRSSSAC